MHVNNILTVHVLPLWYKAITFHDAVLLDYGTHFVSPNQPLKCITYGTMCPIGQQPTKINIITN